MSFAELTALGPVWTAACCVLVFMIGACFGSFVNCFAWRSQNNESILGGRSHCTSCGATLGILDLVPVFSWLLLRGKCRHCGSAIATRYMLAELACGLYFLSMFVFYGAGLHCVALWALGCLLLGLSLCDLENFVIPNGCVLGILTVWVIDLALNALCPSEQLALAAFPHVFVGFLGQGWLAIALEGLAAAVGILLFMLVMTIVVSKRSGADSMGGGDLKLFFAVSLFLGLGGTFFNLIVSCVLGLVLGLAFNSRGNAQENLQKTQDDKACARDARSRQVPDAEEQDLLGTVPSKAFPFGPAIALGTWFTLLVGPFAVSAYMSLL